MTPLEIIGIILGLIVLAIVVGFIFGPVGLDVLGDFIDALSDIDWMD